MQPAACVIISHSGYKFTPTFMQVPENFSADEDPDKILIFDIQE